MTASCVLCVVSLCFGAPALSYPVPLLSRELYSGKLEANRAVRQDRFDSLKEKQGQNVALYIDPDVTSRFIAYPDFYSWSDPMDIHNQWFARYNHLALVVPDHTYDFAAQEETGEHD